MSDADSVFSEGGLLFGFFFGGRVWGSKSTGMKSSSALELGGGGKSERPEQCVGVSWTE